MLFDILIYDVDGVLLKSPQWYVERCQHVARTNGLFVPTVDDMRAVWHLTWAEVIKHFWGDDAERFGIAYEATRYTIPRPKFAGLPKMLRSIHRAGVVQAVLTNRDAKSFRKHAKEAALPLNVFVAIDGIENRAYHKPNPRAFERLWANLPTDGRSPSDAVYVGDALGDWEAARGFGLGFIGVDGYVTSREQFLAAGVPATQIISNPTEIASFIERPAT